MMLDVSKLNNDEHKNILNDYRINHENKVSCELQRNDEIFVRMV